MIKAAFDVDQIEQIIQKRPCYTASKPYYEVYKELENYANILERLLKEAAELIKQNCNNAAERGEA